MKAGIVTLFGTYNYGNRLQNYAVQEIAKSFGFQTYTIRFITDLKREIYRAIKQEVQLLTNNEDAKRCKVLRKFNKEMIPVKCVYARNGKVPLSLRSKFDYFFVGSDQVWNPEIRQKERDIFFLSFAKKKQRICISPSIGVKTIKDEFVEIYRNGLNGFSHLCCREEEGKKEIERITGKNCVRLIDPTLMLDASVWRKFSVPVDASDFIVCFFLGEFPNDLKSKVQSFAEERHLQIINVSDRKSKYYAIDPRELVYLIDHAEAVFTDSFHITAFSINLNTDFWVFDRIDSNSKAMRISSRIATLTSLFALSDRYINNEYDWRLLSKKCDFSKSSIILQKERISFSQFIENVICIDGELS